MGEWITWFVFGFTVFFLAGVLIMLAIRYQQRRHERRRLASDLRHYLHYGHNPHAERCAHFGNQWYIAGAECHPCYIDAAKASLLKDKKRVAGPTPDDMDYIKRTYGIKDTA